MRLTLAIAVARLDRTYLGTSMIEKCLKLALEHAADPSRVHLLLFGNGVPSAILRAEVPSPERWASVRVVSSETNEGVPYALHGMWEALRMDGVAPEQDIVAYLHDDAFIHSDGWDTEVLDTFEELPNCWLAGFSGASMLGLDALYDGEYHIENLIRLDFMSNLLNAEGHGRRVLHRMQVVVNDGYSLITRRSLLDQIGGWTWWPFEHHNYDTAIAAQCLRAGKQVWYIPVKSDHLSGYTANNEEGKTLLENRGGEIAIHRKSARALYDMFRDVLPLRVR